MRDDTTHSGDAGGPAKNRGILFSFLGRKPASQTASGAGRTGIDRRRLFSVIAGGPAAAAQTLLGSDDATPNHATGIVKFLAPTDPNQSAPDLREILKTLGGAARSIPIVDPLPVIPNGAKGLEYYGGYGPLREQTHDHLIHIQRGQKAFPIAERLAAYPHDLSLEALWPHINEYAASLLGKNQLSGMGELQTFAKDHGITSLRDLMGKLAEHSSSLIATNQQALASLPEYQRNILISNLSPRLVEEQFPNGRKLLGIRQDFEKKIKQAQDIFKVFTDATDAGMAARDAVLEKILNGEAPEIVQQRANLLKHAIESSGKFDATCFSDSPRVVHERIETIATEKAAVAANEEVRSKENWAAVAKDNQEEKAQRALTRRQRALTSTTYTAEELEASPMQDAATVRFRISVDSASHEKVIRKLKLVASEMDPIVKTENGEPRMGCIPFVRVQRENAIPGPQHKFIVETNSPALTQTLREHLQMQSVIDSFGARR